MVTPSLDVPSSQVVTKSFEMGERFVKQEVGHILNHCSICSWTGLQGGFPHFAEPSFSGLVVTEDKVVKFEEMKSEWPAAVAVEEAGDECVAKAEGNSGELIDN